jgi:hypothetical protein
VKFRLFYTKQETSLLQRHTVLVFPKNAFQSLASAPLQQLSSFGQVLVQDLNPEFFFKAEAESEIISSGFATLK